MSIDYFSFPSKTFLTGEYAVLEGAPAVLVNTLPRLHFSVTNKKNSSLNTSFHTDSPAGQYLNKHLNKMKNYHISCSYPHNQQGGFGSSSAEFNISYLLTQNVNPSKKTSQDFLFKLGNEYRALHFEGKTPSGADVVSQWVGKVCIFSFKPFLVQTFKWPFFDLDFLILRTGLHLKTWEHLKALKSNYSDLIPLSVKSADCVRNSDKKGFLESINQYTFYLNKNKLIHENTNVFLKKIQSIPEIIVAKGCGAMGAESVCVFFHTVDQEVVLAKLFENVLKHSSATGLNLSEKTLLLFPKILQMVYFNMKTNK